jgi:hypothetical protein
MGGHPCGGDDHLKPGVGGARSELLNLCGRAVRRHDVHLVLDAELVEGLGAWL